MLSELTTLTQGQAELVVSCATYHATLPLTCEDRPLRFPASRCRKSQPCLSLRRTAWAASGDLPPTWGAKQYRNPTAS
jgi:hypothetical protein